MGGGSTEKLFFCEFGLDWLNRFQNLFLRKNPLHLNHFKRSEMDRLATFVDEKNGRHTIDRMAR